MDARTPSRGVHAARGGRAARTTWTLSQTAGAQTISADLRAADEALTFDATATPAIVPLVFASIDVVGDATCGVTTSGATHCWGSNSNARLGTGDFVKSNVLRAVTGGGLFSSVHVGHPNVCGLSEGAAFCWGGNVQGGLGTGGTPTFTQTPLAVSGGHTFTRLATGYARGCGLTSRGAAHCWGSNSNGVLGSGAALDAPVPVKVSGQP